MAAATTVIAGVGLAISAGSTAMSFIQAGQQQKNIRTAQAKADQAMQEARKRLEVNYYEQLDINREKYDLEREALLAQGAQAINPELGRTAIASAGRVQAMQNEAQAGIRTAVGKEMMDIDTLVATEKSRLRDVNAQLDMGEIQGAQQAISDSTQAKAAAMQQGFQGVMGMAQQAANMVPLYMESAAARSLNRAEADYSKMINSGNIPSQFKNADGTVKTFQQAFGMATGNANYGTMNPFEFRDKLTQQGRDFIRQNNPLNVDYSKMMPQQNQFTNYQTNVPNLGFFDYNLRQDPFNYTLRDNPNIPDWLK